MFVNQKDVIIKVKLRMIKFIFISNYIKNNRDHLYSPDISWRDGSFPLPSLYNQVTKEIYSNNSDYPSVEKNTFNLSPQIRIRQRSIPSRRIKRN